MRATLKTENEREIIFRFDSKWGWIALLLGPGLLLLWPRLEADARLWVAVFALVMALTGLLTVLRRFELRLDLVAGTWHRRQGFWPNVATDSGPLDDAKAVAVRYSVGTRDEGGAAVRCNVELRLEGEGWSEPLRYARTQNVAGAHVQAQRVADRLGIPVEEPG